MAFKIIEDLEQADELWRSGLIYFQAAKYDKPNPYCWTLDTSQGNPRSAPSKYYPEDYVYAIQVED